jgi:predicted unusual protein kinase regulating ubiquinone biosynthesis (AarF/ABC1/UbiB family)
MRDLRKVHADPHPGNFLITEDNQIAVLDFGCVKEIPDEFAKSYFQLLHPEILSDKVRLNKLYEELDFFRKEDSESDRKKLSSIYEDMIGLLGKPFHTENFDFGDVGYFQKIAVMGDQFSKDKELRKMNNARGSKDAIYIFRTFFGLYNLLHHLKATVRLEYPLATN